MSSIGNMQVIRSRLRAQPMPAPEPESPYSFNIHHNCARCHDTGEIWTEGLGRAENVPCPDCDKGKERLEYVQKKSYSYSNLPPRYQQYTFATFEDLPEDKLAGKYMALETMRQFCEDKTHTVHTLRVVEGLYALFATLPPSIATLKEKPNVARSGVVLQGVLGVGKTALAAAAMNELISHGREVRFVRVFEALLSLKETWTEGDEIKRLEQYKTAPVLILDELNLTSAERVAPAFQADWVTSILRYREGNDLPTIITCNVDPDQFAAQWGSQCADVVLALCHWVQMGGAKLRDTQQALGEVF